jgi:exopolysaccharide transport family protein
LGYSLTVQKTFLPHEFENSASPERVRPSSQISLVELLRVLRIRRKVIVGTAFVVVALVTATVMQLTPLYTATAVVLLDQRKNSAETTDSALSELPSDQATIQNQVQILTSLKLMDRVIDKLHLEQDPAFNSSSGPLAQLSQYVASFFAQRVMPYLDRLAGFKEGAGADSDMPRNDADARKSAIAHKLLANLVVSPVGVSTTINVAYNSPDPYQSAVIANGIADAYVEDQLEAKFEANQKATQWLARRIQDLSKQAENADAAVQRYKATHHINTPVNGMSVVEQQIRDVNSQLVIARADFAEKQANFNSLVALQAAGKAANASQVLSSPLIATLRAQETDLNRQLADLSNRYLPGHPKIQDLQAQKENLEGKINEEVQRIVESVRNAVSIASAHVGSLQGSLAGLEGQGAGQDQSSVQLTALQSAATSTRSMYEAFLTRLSQTQDREGIQAPDARIISNAEIPASPSFPKKGLSIALAIPAGFLLGLLMAFLAERLDSGFRTVADIEAMAGYPVIATVPEVSVAQGQTLHAADIVIDKPMSSFAEAIRGLQLGLVLSDVDRPAKVVLVTSSVPAEGKTTVAVSLARIAASSGLKTVLLDCDLRRASSGKALSAQFSKSIVDVLTGVAPLEKCLVKDERSGAFTLPSVNTPGNPGDLLSSQIMQKIVSRLREKFDFIIIDSPPVLPVNDAKILSRLADAVLFVVRWEKTPREAVLSSLRALTDVRANISGIAMTRADNERFRHYSYGYQDYKEYSRYHLE